MSQCTFNPCDYPDLHIAVSGQPHYRQLLDDNNQVIGEWFKFMYLDQSDIGKFNDPEILRLHKNLAEHVRGNFDYGLQKWESGFQKFDHDMTGNRDGPNTAYTTGIALQGSYAAAPAVHSTWEKTKDPEFMQWLAKFHCILGDLGGRVMSTVMDDVYNQFTKERHERYNPPFFGPSTGSQTYFTSSQINRSTNTMRLQGTAAGVHCDSTDDELSFSLALNVSVIKDSTSLGYFWFPDFDTLIPVKPMSMIIFQGIEEHTGMPMVLDNNDSSSLPFGYTEDTRFNIICYPKGPTMKNTTYRNYGSFVNSAPERPNLMADALSSFGGKENYDTWRAREILRVNIPNIKNIFGRHIAINIDAEAQYNSISFPDNDSQYTLTPYSVSANNSVEVENLTPPESQAVITTQHTPYQTINIKDIFDNTLFDTFIDKLRQKINFVRHTPFKSSITESNSNAITSLITNSNVENPINQNSIHIAEDENDINDISDIQLFEYNSEKNQNLFDHIGVDNDNDNEPPVRTVDDINSFELFELGAIENFIATLKETSLMMKNQHTFSIRDELKDQIPFLPPVDQTEIQDPSRFIPDFSTTYSRILGTLSKKASQLDPLESGLLAAQGKLAFEHMEMLEHDFFDLFNPTSNIVLPPNNNDEKSTPELYLFVPPVYDFAFRYDVSNKLSSQTMDNIVSIITEEESIRPAITAVNQLAKILSEHFDLDQLFQRRGTKTFNSFLGTNTQQNRAAQRSAILPVGNSTKRKQFDNSISRTVKRSRIERIRPFQQPFELNDLDLNRLNESLEPISGNQVAIDGACSILKCFYSVLKINEICIEILNHPSPIQYFVTKTSNITNSTTLKYVRAACGKDVDKDKLLCARTQDHLERSGKTVESTYRTELSDASSLWTDEYKSDSS
ncbi:uncharacterized protein H6S33_011334 [Morchella sextelata]|uniref:uncharacterized protein n=1 Tax=Morchella sextelata TaxID=1174677 RepID=UPI001D04B2F9|nr:uncharacterized protein H6S33_011334 [Morchella sextelata]KAH0610907.1 hypothetical protein H6S33_011334 [Morchella sextelata]